MTSWARFWAVDFHVHTPGSRDAHYDDYGSAADIVAAALTAGLDAIVITDHNTAAWCNDVAAAATGTGLIVLPGVEISTTEGHLLAVWEEGTDSHVIEDLLTVLGIKTPDRGKLEVAAKYGMAETAKHVVEADGIAIAAHVDRPKGMLDTISVGAHRKRTLLEPCLSAVEVFDLAARERVNAKVGKGREVAFVQGSDTWDSANSRHALSGIGVRRTWVKAGHPDLVGVKHALADPSLRIRLGTSPLAVSYSIVESVEFIGGFLGGQKVTLCPDLNCLLGGTGAGKSLVLEAIRYALDQQVDAAAFPAIHDEVQSRLEVTVGAGLVKVEIATDGRRYLVERPFSTAGDAAPTVYQETGDDWAAIDVAPQDLITLAAFSQGEVLEHSRRPADRMSLVDAGIDLSSVDAEITEFTRPAKQNGIKLLAARKRVAMLREKAAKETEVAEQVRQLAALFDTEVVKQQESWTKERGKLTRVTKAVGGLQAPTVKTPSLPSVSDIADNGDLFAHVAVILQTLKKRVDAAQAEVTEAVAEAVAALESVRDQWQTRFLSFQAKLDAELEKVDGESSLTSLRSHLGSLQEKLAETKAAKEELTNEAIPDLEALEATRENLLEGIRAARAKRRDLRRSRVTHLNAKMSGFVRIDVPDNGDSADYRKALNTLKVGSRVRDDVLDAIAKYTHPFRFARALWHGRVDDLVNVEMGIDAASVARLYANIDEKDLWQRLLNMQLIDRPDILTVRFKKPDDGMYTSIKQLAHGQRCTAILIILLADGDTPVIVDQPEDALHAPWIEDYLVERLRGLRGSRQYIFATRSPGIVVSADAEQIITMRATAGRGELEATGSLERHDLNRLTLHHLEGGPIPFNRRTQKLAVSASQPQ